MRVNDGSFSWPVDLGEKGFTAKAQRSLTESERGGGAAERFAEKAGNCSAMEWQSK
jgi:hypothetical protein